MIMFLAHSKIECMGNAWNVNAWILHGDFLVGNRMDVNIMLHGKCMDVSAWIMHGCECMDSAW